MKDAYTEVLYGNRNRRNNNLLPYLKWTTIAHLSTRFINFAIRTIIITLPYTANRDSKVQWKSVDFLDQLHFKWVLVPATRAARFCQFEEVESGTEMPELLESCWELLWPARSFARSVPNRRQVGSKIEIRRLIVVGRRIWLATNRRTVCLLHFDATRVI